MPTSIEHAFPELGQAKIELHRESEEIFNFLKVALPKSIRHFEHLDHLGKLREIHKTAHHSRWEFIVLQCHLIYFLNHQKGKRHVSFNTNVTLSNGQPVSSVEELLKSWVFLLNFGHLEGTLEAERFWMDLALSDNTLRSLFLSGMPTPKAKSIAEEILKQQNFYQFSVILALFFLGQFKSKGKRRHKAFNINLWIAMLEDFLSTHPDGSTLNRAQHAFRIIRQCSYVYLDLRHSPSIVNFNPLLLREHLSSIGPEEFYDGNSFLMRLINSIEHILFEAIYASPEAVSFKQHYFDTQELVPISKSDFC